MTQRQREQGVVAFHVQVEFQLFAPRTAVAHQSAAPGKGARIPVVQSIVQFPQGFQAFTQHRLVRPIAGVGTVQQRHMACLTHQSRQSYHAQIASFALGFAAACQFSWSGGGDVRVKVGGIERQHVGRQFEVPDGRAGDLDLRLLQVLISDLRGQPVKRLPGESRGRQARHPRYTRFQKDRQMAFGGRRTSTLYRHGEHHLAHGRTGDPYQSSHVADPSRSDGPR
jgi:hypothetical protein